MSFVANRNEANCANAWKAVSQGLGLVTALLWFIACFTNTYNELLMLFFAGCWTFALGVLSCGMYEVRTQRFLFDRDYTSVPQYDSIPLDDPTV